VSVKILESTPVFTDQDLAIPMFWSGNHTTRIVRIGGLFGRKPTYAKMRVKINAVWPWPQPIETHLTINVNGVEKCTLPIQVSDWQEYDVMDVIRDGDNLFEAVLWTTVPLPYNRGVNFTVYLDTDASTEIRLPSQPPQLWWYALAGLVGLTFIVVLVRR